MTDQDRLAAIKEDLAPEELDWLEQYSKGIKDEVLWLIGECERLRGLLRQLEWTGTHCEGQRSETAACPVCGVLADSALVGQLPHAPDCWLAAALA